MTASPPPPRLVLPAALLACLSGCVWHGREVTRRFAPETHVTAGHQGVLTVTGRRPPTTREVHRFRLHHGAPRVQRAPGEAFPWWPGVRDGALGALAAAGDGASNLAGRAAHAAEGPDLHGLAPRLPYAELPAAVPPPPRFEFRETPCGPCAQRDPAPSSARRAEPPGPPPAPRPWPRKLSGDDWTEALWTEPAEPAE